MKKMFFPLLFLGFNHAYTQALSRKLAIGVQQLEADSQMQHAIIGLSVFDSKTGRPVYEHNAQVGLAPASTQKLFTSCAAFELLGKDYRYSTEIGYNNVTANPAKSWFIVKCSGDPSFGSFRFAETKPSVIIDHIIAAVRKSKIAPVSNSYHLIDSSFDMNAIPGGWIWEDIGNYYGAGAAQFNWMENQYDIVFKSGSAIGSKVSGFETKPALIANLNVQVTTAEKGTGDNTIVFPAYGSMSSIVEGTIPVNEDAFVISAAIPDPFNVFAGQLANKMVADSMQTSDLYAGHPSFIKSIDSPSNYMTLYKHSSPPFDSLNYWFLKKSINLYGEAFIKTIAFEKSGFGSTQKGVELLKDFWSQHGIEKPALHICDGSGLSPQNRVTSNALVKVLQYAKTRPWFSSFYYALPEYNGMKMKSGSIGGARAFAGYQQAKDGNEYCFAIIINNYDGSSLAAVRKMYRLLDELK
jgi:D-alanyl-D-alanine carboxypeptidase/D-alanyl-D-alanine-endopeptidase (penicillin-binding protein 4)